MNTNATHFISQKRSVIAFLILISGGFYPSLSNHFLFFFDVHKKKNNLSIRFWDFFILICMLILLCVLDLLSCGIFGLEVTNSGITQYELTEFLGIRIIISVWMQVSVLITSPHFCFLVLLCFVTFCVKILQSE